VRFLVDECTGPGVAQRLRSLGHDVISIYDECRGVPDADVLALAYRSGSILITNDKDFGELIHRGGGAHCGVVLLRLSDERPVAKIRALDRLLGAAIALEHRMVVVTDEQIRVSGARVPSAASD